jgi:hypothetical protein
MEKIYVIEGATGAYEDYHTWLVSPAYLSKAKAEEHLRRLEAVLDRLPNTFSHIDHIPEELAKLDDRFGIGRGLIEYSLDYEIRELSLNTDEIYGDERDDES